MISCVPDVTNTASGTALLCGSGASLFEDYAPWSDSDFDVIAINFAVLPFLKIAKHFVSLEPALTSLSYFPYAIKVPNKECLVHAAAPGEGDVVWTLDSRRGSSGMFGCKVADALGYDRIIMCGMSMQATDHFYDLDPSDGPDYGRNHDWPYWESRADEMRGKFFSMSGRTRDLLGAPDGF